MTDTTKNESNGSDQEIAEKVESIIAERINPALAGHGGFVRLSKVEDSDVYLELGGGCKGCAGARATMRYGVETALRDLIPNIGQVIDATDHSA